MQYQDYTYKYLEEPLSQILWLSCPWKSGVNQYYEYINSWFIRFNFQDTKKSIYQWPSQASSYPGRLKGRKLQINELNEPFHPFTEFRYRWYVMEGILILRLADFLSSCDYIYMLILILKSKHITDHKKAIFPAKTEKNDWRPPAFNLIITDNAWIKPKSL